MEILYRLLKYHKHYRRQVLEYLHECLCTVTFLYCSHALSYKYKCHGITKVISQVLQSQNAQDESLENEYSLVLSLSNIHRNIAGILQKYFRDKYHQGTT